MKPYTVDELFADFVADWHATLFPCVSCYCGRCVAPQDRAEFTSRVEKWLETAETPEYSNIQRDRIAQKIHDILERRGVA